MAIEKEAQSREIGADMKSWRAVMKAPIISAAALALFISPVMAQTKADTMGLSAKQGQQLPRLIAGSGLIRGNDVYDCTGKYLGSDPDSGIRHQLLREGVPTCK